MSTDPNVQALRNVPLWGHYIFNAFRAMQKQLGNVSSQGNINLAGAQNSAPPSPNAVTVTASGGVAHIQITDNNQNLYRGITYHTQYSTDPSFSTHCNGPSGPSRDIRIPVGTQPLYYRVFSDYPTSPASAPVYHGGATPVALAATGTEQPPIPSGQGSGTGTPGQISGYGPLPWRGNSPPKRG
jgi:hypothetical protein